MLWPLLPYRIVATTVLALWMVGGGDVSAQFAPAYPQSPPERLTLNAPQNADVPLRLEAPNLGFANTRFPQPDFMPATPKPLPARPGFSMTSDQTRQSVQWLADQLMLHVPRRIEGDDDWGQTKKVWAGVKVHRDGWELKTNRRWRELRHGRWVRYEIQLPPRRLERSDVEVDGVPILAAIDRSDVPDAIQIHSVTAVTTDAGFRRWQVDASMYTPATFAVRVERWNLGAQWYSIEIIGKMQLQMRSVLTMAMEADFAEVPPAMQLDVQVKSASLNVAGFEVDRISKLGGDVAEELGDLAEKTVGKIWVNKENARLAARLNKAIADNRDSLRWSMADWLVQLTQ
ncbi:hypothetical protein [Aporhodopirellula aestuarii]|uniref:Uncharacterized protein n=1 Tax=Aporhodopirellula aestuarii TaxID=2950107 RepID=A0ABT0U6N7_9BACT|nr:hypothetical protein [Aporhodopirellula aestuarii]MCM2372558.1 hypothetical protein [Aporhodopirellula aestuarii]